VSATTRFRVAKAGGDASQRWHGPAGWV
jgi:hypothetical protein